MFLTYKCMCVEEIMVSFIYLCYTFLRVLCGSLETERYAVKQMVAVFSHGFCIIVL